MTRGPYQLVTRAMTPEERLAWWNRNGGNVAPQREPLSLVWRKALRQDWGLD